MNSYKIIVLACVFLVLTIFVSFGTQKQQNNSLQPTISITPQELSTTEYKKLRDELMDLVIKQNPRIALATLREQTKTDEAITRSCHDLVHEIGHEAYEKYGDFAKAMQYQDELCNSGYLHGIIESHFAKTQDIFETMKTVCNKYSATRFIGWECFHGVGHGLMYFTQNDLPKSISLCNTYNNYDSRIACINGVFMENFNTDQKLHVSKYVKANDPFYPCNKQKLENKSTCYLYAPTYFLSLHKNDYTKALQWCKTAENDFRLVCISGVGSQAIKEHIASPKFIESLCMQGSTDETNACIQGMVGLYINHFGGIKEATQLCSTLKKTNQLTCQQTIASEESLF